MLGIKIIKFSNIYYYLYVIGRKKTDEGKKKVILWVPEGLNILMKSHRTSCAGKNKILKGWTRLCFCK